MAIDGGSVEIRFEGDVSPLRRSVEEAVDSLESVKEAANDVDKSLAENGFSNFGKKSRAEFVDFADSAAEAFSSAIDSASSFVKSVESIGTALKGIGFSALQAGAAGVTTAFVSLAKKGIQATDFLETSRVAMSGLTGSVEEGNKAMTMAAKYWQSHPFQRIDVTNATKQLVQFGRTTDQLTSDLEMLGNVSLSTNMGIDELARYYARVSASGRAMTRDLEMMSDRGVPIYRELQKQLGTTTDGVRKMASEGKISFEIFRKAMEGAVNQEAMDEYENTMARQVDRLKGSVQIIAGEMAGYKIINNELVISEEGLEKAWTRLLKTLASGLRSDEMKAAFAKIGDALAKVVDIINKVAEPALKVLSKALDFVGDNAALLMPILGGALALFGRLGANIPVVGQVIQGLSKNFNGVYLGVKNFISLHPLLSAFFTLLSVGFVDAMKNDEEFKKTISELLTSLKQIISNLMEAFKGLLPVIKDTIHTIAGSGMVKGILQAVAGALKLIASALASIPPEALAGIMSFILSLKLLNTSPIMFAVTAIALLIQYVKELGGIGEIFNNLPQKLATIGHNIMVGLFNGVKEGASKVINYVKQVASAILSTFRNMFGIHSPSTVMYDMGINMGLGLANGITDSTSAVELAMTNLAEDILKLSEKIISNKVDFGILDINAEYKEWKKVSKLFTQGSEQYNYALEKMEEARKKANLKILELQKSYNNELNSTIKKISSMYGLFDEVNLGGSKNSSKILKNLDQQVAKMQEWAEAQKSIASLGLDDELVKELQAMGVDATGELSAIAQMTSDELSTLNDMWLQKQSIANDAGVRQMEDLKNDTLDQIAQLKDGIDGTTVDIADVGGRLVENIAEGVYGAMPTLESAFGKLNDYIEKAQKELAKQMGGTGSEVDNLGGADALGVPDTGIAGIKEEITNSLEKVKSMLPNILLGALGAVGVVKFGPKILRAITDKLFDGGTISQGLGSLLGGGKGGFSTYLDQLLAEADEGSGIQKALLKIQSKINKDEIDAIKALDTGRYDDSILDKLDPNSDKYWEAVAKMNKSSGKSIKKAAGSLKETQTATATIARDTVSVSDSVEATGKGMSKAQSWMKSIQEGAKTVIYIAGAIAAVAGALWITYNALKDVDFVKLAEQLVFMGLAVVEFGALAKAADMLKISAKSILIIVGIAVDIAAVALACRTAYEVMKDIPWDGFASALGMMAAAIGTFGLLNGILGIKVVALAEAFGLLVSAGIIIEIIALSKSIRIAYDTMKDISWEGFGQMLGQMATALGVMGALNGPLGLLMPLAALGWVSISLICDEMIKLAKALVEVDRNVPEDFDSLEKKLKHLKKTLEIINGLDLGTVIGMMVTSWSAGPVERIMEMYVKVAEALNKLSKIELDQEAIEANLEYIRLTLETIDAKTDLISGWLEASRMDVEASTVENAGRIVIVYGDMVDALDKLANFKPDEAGISTSLLAMVGVITLLRNQSYGSGGIFNIFNNMETVANDVEKIKSIVKNYLEMVPTMQDLGKPENKISDSVRSVVEKNIENIKSIVHTIGSVDTGGWIDQKESDMGKIQSILNKFTELIPVANQIANMNIAKGDDRSGAIKRIKDIKSIVIEIGSVDTGGWIDQKESDMGKIQSILNKFTEVAQTCGLLTQYPIPSNAQSWIQTVRHLVWEIGQINQDDAGSLDAKADIIEKSKTIAKKLGEFGSILSELKGSEQGGVIESLTSALDQLLTGVSNSMTEKVAVFENVGVQIGQSLARGITSQSEALSVAGGNMQSSIWAGVNGKIQDEYWQGVELANKFGDGVKSVDFQNVGASLQSSLWWGIQNRMNDEYWQGRSMGERFRQGLYDVDYGNAGWWAVQGFINGAWGRAGSGDGVYHTGWWIANNFLQGLKDRGNQGSPWKTTMESGNWAVEGLIEGMKSQEDALVGEATSLADQVINALTMDDVVMTPTLDANVNGHLAPTMAEGDYGIVGGNGQGVTIRQTNNNYTQYDVEQVQRDLAWELSKV